MNKKVKKEVVENATKAVLPFVVTAEELKRGVPGYVYVYTAPKEGELPFLSPIVNDPLTAAVLMKKVREFVTSEIKKPIGVYKLVKVA